MDKHYTLVRAYWEVVSQAAHIFHSTPDLTLDDRLELHEWASQHLPTLEEELDKHNLSSETIVAHLAFELQLSRNY